MVKKVSKIIEPSKADSWFKNTTSQIATWLAIGSALIGAGMFMGSHFRNKEYEAQIQDLKFQLLQMQIDCQREISEARYQNELDSRAVSIDDLKKILSEPVTIVTNGK